MIVANLLPYVRTLTPWLFLGLIAARLLTNKFGNGINHIPGPWLASFSDIWRFLLVWGRRPEVAHRALHAKYGSLVRIGPRTVIASEPDAIKTIYALNAGFTKVNRFSLLRF